MNLISSCTLNIETKSEANCSEHWTKKSKRHKQQQFFIRLAFRDKIKETPVPCVIKLVRLSNMTLDDDNLVSAFKWIRDEISECIFPEKVKVFKNNKGEWKKLKGRADSDPRIKWEYSQEKTPIQSVRIDIFSNTPKMHDHIVDECIL